MKPTKLRHLCGDDHGAIVTKRRFVMTEKQITENHQMPQVIELSDEQQRAVPLILMGRSDREVAQEIGVTRETVTRWRNEYPVFIAALNHERWQLWDASRNNVHSLVRKALAVVEKAMDQNDTRAALAILKMTGFADVGLHAEEFPEDPDDIIFRQCQDEVFQERRLRIRTDPEIHRQNRVTWLLSSREERDYLLAIAKFQQKKATIRAGDEQIVHPEDQGAEGVEKVNTG
jgi:hypothetical protein